jgi:4'-phosphopantetheinyl transferase EntD
MTTTQGSFVQPLIEAIAPPGIVVGHRVIMPGDEAALLPEEFAPYANSVIKVRRASGAARMVARELLPRLGQAPQALPKSASGAPVWPEGIIGSLAHDADIAVAALARRHDYAGLGIDIEPAQPLDHDLLGIIATPSERRAINDDPLQAHVLFTIKEAVYKATHPIDGVFLEHHDVEVSLSTGAATIRNGRVVRFKHRVGAHIVALAFIAASAV